MLTLGVDLSCDMKKTAVWSLEDVGSHLAARPVTRPGTPGDLLNELLNPRVDAIAIDAPFGWPEDFVLAIGRWQRHDSWLRSMDPLTEHRNTLYRRVTERLLWERNLRPLSTSSDRIGATAMLCAWLLDQYHQKRGKPLDRVNGLIIETYPAAVLSEWGLPSTGYKEGKGKAVRKKIIQRLLAEAPTLEVDAQPLERSDHALDALICALVARAEAMNRTVKPTRDEMKQAKSEGWIHIPESGLGLRQLSTPAPVEPRSDRQSKLRAQERLMGYLAER